MRTLTAAVIAVTLTATGIATAQPAGGTVAAVKARGRLIVLCVPGKGNTFVAPKGGHSLTAPGGANDFAGVDVDLMKRLAASLGVGLEIRPVKGPVYAELIPALERGEGDLIASSFTITPERMKQVAFSQPYYSIWVEIVTRKGSAITRAAELGSASAAAVPGSSQQQRLKALGVTRIVPVASSREAVEAVAAGRADVAAVDTGTAVLHALPAGVGVSFRLTEGANYGIAVRPGSDLLPMIDRLIEDLRLSGELGAIVRAHEGYGS